MNTSLMIDDKDHTESQRRSRIVCSTCWQRYSRSWIHILRIFSLAKHPAKSEPWSSLQLTQHNFIRRLTSLWQNRSLLPPTSTISVLNFSKRSRGHRTCPFQFSPTELGSLVQQPANTHYYGKNFNYTDPEVPYHSNSGCQGPYQWNFDNSTSTNNTQFSQGITSTIDYENANYCPNPTDPSELNLSQNSLLFPFTNDPSPNINST